MAEHLEPLLQAGGAKRPSANIVQTSRDDAPPASAAQERLWTLHRALPHQDMDKERRVLHRTVVKGTVPY